MAYVRTERKWTGSNSGKKVKIVEYTTQDVAALEGDITEVEITLGAGRLMVTFYNDDAANDATIKFWTSDMLGIPNSTHATSEWDQEPDGATTYTVAAKGRLKRGIVGPVNWFKIRALDGVGTTGKRVGRRTVSSRCKTAGGFVTVPAEITGSGCSIGPRK